MQIKIIRKHVKNIIIKIKEINVVEIVAPNFVTKDRIDDILNLRASWIEQKFKELEQDEANKIKLENGDLISFLGKNYKLAVEVGEKNGVELINDTIILTCSLDSDFIKKDKILNDWYRQRAKEIFTEILSRFCLVVGKEIKSIKIRKMKTRWGSCNSKKAYINLNLELIKKPITAIEAVIMHELTHLYHANHSKAFYNTLLNFMPDYYDRIKILKANRIV